VVLYGNSDEVYGTGKKVFKAVENAKQIFIMKGTDQYLIDLLDVFF